jgi:tetratricopeptide (TPR) repeat protein
MVQSVAWVTELKNTQSGLFYLLSIFYFLKWSCGSQPVGVSTGKRAANQQATDSVDPQQNIRIHSWMLFALSLCCFSLGTLSKPSVVMLPVVLALCIWWQRGRISRLDLAALVPFMLISMVASAWTVFEQKFHAGAVGAEWAQTWQERLIIAGRVIWFYLGKLVWPHPLIFIYPRWEIHSSNLAAYVPLVLALILLALIWSAATCRHSDVSAQFRTKWARPVLFAVAYYVVSLFPILGFFDVFFFRYSFVSDHFQYLASMGPLALLGAGAVTAAERFAEIGPVKLKSCLLVTTAGIFLLLLVFLTWRQTGMYHDLITLYTATLRSNPGCWMADYNLGIALSERGKADEAIAHYQHAIELRPRYAEAHYNLGRLLAQKGQLDAAVSHYRKALEINPADAEARNNLGVTLFGLGRVDDAIADYQSALKIRPDYAEASCNLANALLSKGDLDGAIVRYSTCLELSPDQAEAQYNLASALLRRGRTDEAIVHYQKVLELQADNADAYANLGSALLERGRVREAITAYRNGLRISPENVPAQSNLAWLLATSSDSSLRNGSEAVSLAEQAESESSRSANYPIVLRILAAAYAESGRFEEARQTAQRALRAAEVQGNSTLADALHDEIALYDLGLPYHKGR